MDKDNIIVEVDESRRKFIEKAGKVSVAAPAAAILLSGGMQSAQAQAVYPYTDSSDNGGGLTPG